MADLQLSVSSGVVALVSATAKTVLQVKTTTNQRAVLKGFIVAGAMAAGGTDAAVKARFTRSTTNFGTGSTATPGKLDTSKTETIQSSCFSNFTVEPTTPTDAGYYLEFNPESGMQILWPEAMWMKIPGGQSLQLELTSVSGTPNVVVTFIFDE